MLHILLLILKIIGIVLLVILGGLLLGIACALFVPVRYRIEAARLEEEGAPPVEVRIKVTWLLHLINVLLRFDGKLFVRARILLFTVFRMPKKEKRIKEAGEEGKKNKRTKHRNEEPVPQKDREEGVTSDETVIKDGLSGGSAVDAVGTAEAGGISQEHRAGADQGIQSQPSDQAEDKVEEAFEETPEKPGLRDKLRVVWKILRKLYEKIKGFFENIQYTINKFCDKIRSVSETIEYYRDVVEGEPFKRSFALCKKELLAICKSLKPKKFEASLIVGMDDPASTGEILAVCGMLYPIIGGHVDVRGDFENKRLEGKILIVGKLRMFTFLRTAVKIYFNKDIRKLYRQLKRRQ